MAEKNAHASDDGEITKEERKALDAAHKKQLHNRHRGVMQFRPYRTAIWMKDGVKNRLTTKKNNGKRERECSEFLPPPRPDPISCLPSATVKSEA